MVSKDGSSIRTHRALLASPLLLVSAISFLGMDVGATTVMLEPISLSGVISWQDGSIPILNDFFRFKFLNDLWRGITIAFAPSTLGFDEISWWQMSHFIMDVGALFGIWLLEASRPIAARKPIKLAIPIALFAQILGIGTVAPLLYFFHYTFAIPAEKTLKLTTASIAPVFPGIIVPLVISTAHIPAALMYLSTKSESRHYWTWAWQMYPIWYSLSYVALSHIHSARQSGSSGIVTLPSATLPKLLLLLGTPSALSWLHILFFSPFQLSSVLLPQLAAQETFALVMRRSLQIDELCAGFATFIWLGLEISDVWRAKASLSGKEPQGLWLKALGGIFSLLLFGPGVTFLVLWAWKEEMLRKGLEA